MNTQKYLKVESSRFLVAAKMSASLIDDDASSIMRWMLYKKVSYLHCTTKLCFSVGKYKCDTGMKLYN
jgi:hypothetical protein